MIKCTRTLAAALLLMLTAPWQAMADEVQVAVASNFLAPLTEIAAAFKQETGHEAIISSGATSKLFAQIQNGAPFEVMVAADSKTPSKLVKAELALTDTQFTYAKGKLVLWSPMEGREDDLGAMLKGGDFQHLAIANPKTAPYGAAAMEVLAKLDLEEATKAKLVEGENISQAFQFVASHNAELGFVALSQIYKDGKLTKGSAWIVPADMYSPLTQDAVLLKKGEHNPAASALLAFLKGDKAKAIIQAYGYQL